MRKMVRRLQAAALLVGYSIAASISPALAVDLAGNPATVVTTEASVVVPIAPENPVPVESDSSKFELPSHVTGIGLSPEEITMFTPPIGLEPGLRLQDDYRNLPEPIPSQPVKGEQLIEVIVIDNDLYKEKKHESEVFTWKTVRSEAGKNHIEIGAQFPIALVSSHTSKTGRVGDRVEARLISDVQVGDKLVACKNDRVLGHISRAYKARRLLFAELSPKRWNGAIGPQFDEIITSKGEHLPLIAMPAKMSRIVSNKAEGRILGVNAKGEIVSPLSIQLKHQGIHLAIRGAASAGGVFSIGAVPIAFGVIGAINPSFAFMHPVGTNVHHRRLKGFGMGVLSGLPGGFIVSDYLIRGVESSIKPGDKFVVAFKQQFTGEPATYAQLNPQSKLLVKGEVVRSDK